MNRRSKEKIRLQKREQRLKNSVREVTSCRPCHPDTLTELIGDSTTEVPDAIIEAGLQSYHPDTLTEVIGDSTTEVPDDIIEANLQSYHPDTLTEVIGDSTTEVPDDIIEANLQSYHPDTLTELIGDSTTEVPDDIIEAGLQLIRTNCNADTGEYYGYYTPAQIQLLTVFPSHRGSSTLLPLNKDSIHVHPLSRHWVTSYFCSNRRQLYVFDSVQNMIHLREVKHQLLYMYDSDIVNNLIYGKVTQQSTEPLCGIMALAFAFTCFLGENPININYDITKARDHLKTCFRTGTLSPFPLTTSEDCNWIYSYIAEQTRQSVYAKAKAQAKRQNTSVSVQQREGFPVGHGTHKNCVWSPGDKHQAHINQRKSRNDEHMQTDRLQTDRSKARIRKAEYRRNRGAVHVNVDRVKDKTRKRQLRQSQTPEQKASQALKDMTRKRQLRKSKAPEQKASEAEKDKTRKRRLRKSQAPEQKASQAVKDITRMKQLRKSKAPEQKASEAVKDKTRKRRLRKSQAPEQKASQAVKDITRMKQLRKSKAPEQKASEAVKDKTRKRRLRKSQAPEQKASQAVKDKTRKRQLRKSQAPEQKASQAVKGKTRKRQLRKSQAPEQKASQAVKDKMTKKCKRHPKDVDSAIDLFRKNIRDAAEYVCTVCHRMLYRNSVNRFVQTTDLSRVLNTHELSPDGLEYICTTCKRHLSKMRVPPQAQANKMSIPNPPPVLSNLTDFEGRLLARRYPFMKIVQLPKGKQRGIIGRVVNVPVDAAELCTSLPRTLSASGILPVKLKRKILYKGHVNYQNIRPEKIKQAFHWLVKNNKYYQNVVESIHWENECKEENNDVWQHFTESSDAIDSNVPGEQIDIASTKSSDSSDDSDASSDADDFIQPSVNSEATQFDTCVQPSDPAADACDIMSIAPGEGRHPLHIMMDPGCEEQAFPHLFPTGCYGFTCERATKLTPKKYFNARILNKKGTFAKNIEYLFFAQYVTEHKQVMDTVSVAVRKTFRARPMESSIDAGFIKDPDRLKSLILKDKAYNFLHTVRGSPPYWQKIMYKLMAAVKQFGIFSLFVTFSSADMKWNDTLNALLRQQGRQLTNDEIEALTWEERCALLRSNPVTTARHFDHRLQCCFNDLLLSPAQVLGKVVHYSYRIEFQQRGSPHAHCVLWTEDAPKPTDDPEKITEYIDQYISCEIPREEDDPELHGLVTTVQKHHHTATCRKKGTTCRFHYPKLPSPITIIAAPLDSDDEVFKEATFDTAFDILVTVMDTLDNDKEHKITSTDELLSNCNITLEQYVYALSITKRGRTVVLKRQPDEVFINCYNRSLLRAWQANLDVQFCLDPYACIAYMVSYITKDEREMSVVLRNITKDMAYQDYREQMKSCANAFLNARELSAQEAVYRLLSLPLFKSNFSSVFVPADVPDKRVAFLKPMTTVMSMDDDEEDIFTTSILDRYSARPEILKGMCLAEFAVTYIPDSKAAEKESDQEESEETTHVIQLKNGLGGMKKRCKKSVLRYHHKSEAKQPEEYYYSQLLLFLPWYNESTELLSLPSYQQHYNDNIAIVEQNRSQLQHHEDVISLAIEQFEQLGPPTHAYDEIAAHSIQENEGQPEAQNDDDFAVLDPDNSNITSNQPSIDFPVASGNMTSVLDKRLGFWKEEDYQQQIRQLNDQQRDAFQSVFTWCHTKNLSHKSGTNPEQLCLFVSGGAGTGKSHLISAIYQMALRAFQVEGENPDDIRVLLTAPTGTAAHNIGGLTLHSAFLLPLGQTRSFVTLSDDKRNTIRAKTSNLELLIIDEISMVGTNLLLQLHYRLCEIKCSKKPFGGVSVLVFGDLYQLPPVKQKFVFEPVSDAIARLHGSLWQEFLLVELTKIMRQKEDIQFAELLNRVRTQSHNPDDIRILSSRQLSPPSEDKEALHVFPTNKEVDTHNRQFLDNLSHPVETLVAVDKKPNSLTNYKPSNDARFTGGLASEVQLGIGAKVMLTKNLDTSDGLVNGAQGKVVGFIRCGNNPANKIVAILIEFESQNVGLHARQTSQFTLELTRYPSATPVLRAETNFTVSRKNKDLKVTRYQFPLKLSWACTIHKVQGLTLDAVVVSFEKRYGNGQAYVALSRAKTLNRLYLSSFDEKKLICSKQVSNEMKRLQTQRKFPLFFEFLTIWQHLVIVSVLNTRSYPRHREDLLHEPIFIHSDLVVLSETWLSEQIGTRNIVPDNYVCFRSDKPATQSESRAGGVAVLVKNGSFNMSENIMSYRDKHLQVVTVQLTTKNLTTMRITGVYNSPCNSISSCEKEVLRHMQHGDHDHTVICTGDFNKNSPLCALQDLGFTQHVSTSTHISGSCLDHFYSKGLHVANTKIVPCYFSDHNWVSLSVITN